MKVLLLLVTSSSLFAQYEAQEWTFFTGPYLQHTGPEQPDKYIDQHYSWLKQQHKVISESCQSNDCPKGVSFNKRFLEIKGQLSPELISPHWPMWRLVQSLGESKPLRFRDMMEAQLIRFGFDQEDIAVLKGFTKEPRSYLFAIEKGNHEIDSMGWVFSSEFNQNKDNEDFLMRRLRLSYNAPQKIGKEWVKTIFRDLSLSGRRALISFLESNQVRGTTSKIWVGPITEYEVNAYKVDLDYISSKSDDEFNQLKHDYLESRNKFSRKLIANGVTK